MDKLNAEKMKATNAKWRRECNMRKISTTIWLSRYSIDIHLNYFGRYLLVYKCVSRIV
jgi:hypothetical protein